jgi:hypothetical protein
MKAQFKEIYLAVNLAKETDAFGSDKKIAFAGKSEISDPNITPWFIVNVKYQNAVPIATTGSRMRVHLRRQVHYCTDGKNWFYCRSVKGTKAFAVREKVPEKWNLHGAVNELLSNYLSEVLQGEPFWMAPMSSRFTRMGIVNFTKISICSIKHLECPKLVEIGPSIDAPDTNIAFLIVVIYHVPFAMQRDYVVQLLTDGDTLWKRCYKTRKPWIFCLVNKDTGVVIDGKRHRPSIFNPVRPDDKKRILDEIGLRVLGSKEFDPL